MNATATTPAVLTDAELAELYLTSTDSSKAKWAFLDGVHVKCQANPTLSQKEVIDGIGDTPRFIAMHGNHREGGVNGANKGAAEKAKSKLKSIRDEVSVVKLWTPQYRVEGVSFEAHKILNRLGAPAGNKILTTLVKDMGGPGNVTKAAVAARLKVADPDHVPKANGKAPAAGNPTVTGAAGLTAAMPLTIVELARQLADKLTVGELGKDTALAAEVLRIADVFEAFSHRNAAKAAAKAAAPAPTPKAAAPKAAAGKVKAPAVKAPGVRKGNTPVPSSKPKARVLPPVLNVLGKQGLPT